MARILEIVKDATCRDSLRCKHTIAPKATWRRRNLHTGLSFAAFPFFVHILLSYLDQERQSLPERKVWDDFHTTGTLHCVHHNGSNNEIGSNGSNQAVVCVCVGGGGGGDSLFNVHVYSVCN